MEDEIRANEWINANQAGRPEIRPKAPPKVDNELSKLVGHKIMVNDQRVIKKVAEWRRSKDPEKPDNFLKDPQKVAELKKILQ